MKLSDFDYDLPKSFIAQDPVSPRDSSKLLVYDSLTDKVSHGRFKDVVEYIGGSDVLVLNRSKVIKARIRFGIDGRECEIFLLKNLGPNLYECMVRPGKKFINGFEVDVAPDLSAKVLEVKSDGLRIIQFDAGMDVEEFGEAPFPPYIENSHSGLDDYQTVYAREKGSVASPTAGLHFTERLLSEIRDRGVFVEEVLLHVGLGTFQPVKTVEVKDHNMHSEFFELDGEVADRLNKAKALEKRIVAVGTTSVRVLESSFKGGVFVPSSGETDIFIYPGYKWRVVDVLMTNFHLPKSTLIMLVASFLQHKGVKNGARKILDLYEEAKKENYRFYSFGDSMIIL